jgi:hypothetical protein
MAYGGLGRPTGHLESGWGDIAYPESESAAYGPLCRSLVGAALSKTRDAGHSGPISAIVRRARRQEASVRPLDATCVSSGLP